MNSIRIATILVALVATACSAGAGSPSAVASSPPSAAASSTVAPTASPVDAFQGTWTTGVVTCEQEAAVIHAGGFTDTQMLVDRPCTQPGAYRLRFSGTQLGIFEQSGNGPWELGATASYALPDDHTIVTTDSYDGSQGTLSYTLVGNVLTFTSTNASAGSELGSMIAGLRIFLSAPFTKDPS
jgi:hypothetical protein